MVIPSERRPVAPTLRRWLRRPGSLSAHVQALGERFEVQRLSQRVARLLPGEARSLGLAPGTRCVVREVVLRVDGRPVVLGRSVAPARSLNGPWRSLGSLGTRPLAQLLFDTPQVTRSPLVPMRLAGAGRWQQRLDRCWQLATGAPWPEPAAWGRYSIFRKNGAPLRVTEVFAPAMHGASCPAIIRPEHVRARARLGSPKPAVTAAIQAMRTDSGGRPSTSASSTSPATTAATPSGVPV
jgi:chorismate--pyruvate lyase